MSGTARAEAYDRHTGRYGPELSAAFVRFVGIEPGMRVLDVGCGPGALTNRLAHVVGGDRVLAVDPAEAYADVAAPGGVIAGGLWDFRGGMPLLDAYWAAARSRDPEGARAAGDDSANPWCTRDSLRRLWEEAGIAQAEIAELSAGARYDGFDDAWFSFAAGAGFSGAYCRSLDDRRRAALREEFRRRLAVSNGPFRLEAWAWAVLGHG